MTPVQSPTGTYGSPPPTSRSYLNSIQSPPGTYGFPTPYSPHHQHQPPVINGPLNTTTSFQTPVYHELAQLKQKLKLTEGKLSHREGAYEAQTKQIETLKAQGMTQEKETRDLLEKVLQNSKQNSTAFVHPGPGR